MISSPRNGKTGTILLKLYIAHKRVWERAGQVASLASCHQHDCPYSQGAGILLFLLLSPAWRRHTELLTLNWYMPSSLQPWTEATKRGTFTGCRGISVVINLWIFLTIAKRIMDWSSLYNQWVLIKNFQQLNVCYTISRRQLLECYGSFLQSFSLASKMFFCSFQNFEKWLKVLYWTFPSQTKVKTRAT